MIVELRKRRFKLHRIWYLFLFWCRNLTKINLSCCPFESSQRWWFLIIWLGSNGIVLCRCNSAEENEFSKKKLNLKSELWRNHRVCWNYSKTFLIYHTLRNRWFIIRNKIWISLADSFLFDYFSQNKSQKKRRALFGIF